MGFGPDGDGYDCFEEFPVLWFHLVSFFDDDAVEGEVFGGEGGPCGSTGEGGRGTLLRDTSPGRRGGAGHAGLRE